MEQRSIRTAVVTGPTGAIGHALCQKLLIQGCTVYAVSHSGGRRTDTFPQDKRLHLIFCDAAQYEDLPGQIPEKADAFFHLAWAHTTGAGRNDLPAQVDNIRNTVQAVRAAAALGCRVFVGAGSQAEYGRVEGLLRPDIPANPENGYGMAKLCAGQMSRLECERLGLDHVWPRVLSVYGPYDGPNSMIPATIRALLAGQCPALTEGCQRWDYLYAADAAEAFWQMAVQGRSGAIYPLGGGSARPLREYLETLRDAIDPRLPLGLGQLPYGSRQVMHLEADLTALERDTGFVPATPFAEGIRKTIEWIRTEQP